MINLSAESFPDDSIIQNISGVFPQNAPPAPPRIIVNNGVQPVKIDEHPQLTLPTASSRRSATSEPQQVQQLLTPFVTIDLARRSAVSPESAASDDSILQHISGEFPQNATPPQPLIVIDDGVQSAAPPQIASRESDKPSSLAESQQLRHQPRLLSPFDSSIDQTRRSASPESASSSTTSLRSNTNTKTYTKSTKASGGTGGATRRIGAAYGRMLSTKSASVDGLHQQEPPNNDDDDVDRTSQSSLGSTKLGAGTRRTRYDHVQSKVKMFIDSQREQDNRRRSAKLERHRSMPESLCTQMSVDGGGVGAVAMLAPLAAGADPSNAELAALHTALQHKDQLLAEKELLIQNINTCYETSNLRDTDERLKLERKVDLLRWELQKAHDERRNYEEELEKLKRFQQQHQQASSSGSSTVSPSALTVGFEGLHHRQIMARHNNLSSSSATSSSIMRPIIEHSRKSDYRLLSAAVTDASSTDEEDEIGPIITSSSASQDVLAHKSDGRRTHSTSALRNEEEERSSADDDETNGLASRHQQAGSRKRGRDRRKVRTMRKRLRRMLRRCVPCLDKSQESEEIEADISLLYAGIEDHDGQHDVRAIGAGESTRTTTTGYSSF